MPRTVAILTLVLALPAAAAAQQAEPTTPLPEIVSSASAERPVVANLAVLTVRFSRDGATPLAAGHNVALAADSLRRSLGRLGIPRDSIANGSRWYWWRDRIQEIREQRSVERWVDCGGRQTNRCRNDSTYVEVRYRANENLQIRIRDLSRVGQAIDTLLSLGITDFGDVAFSATNSEREQREAIHEATELAVARATTIADAGGGHLGRTLRLSTDGDGEVHYTPFDYLTVSAQGGPSTGGTVLVSPVLRVTATVHGRWEFVPGAR
jgi:uncharacterized protein YggE